jgi:PAS domain S-box-containing protein
MFDTAAGALPADFAQDLQSLFDPEGQLDGIELGDLIEPMGLQRLMDDFYQLANVPMSILDRHGRVLAGVGWQEICTAFHREHPQTAAHCLESDTQLSAGLHQGEFRLYRCKNSMWDIATPIVVGGKVLGNIFSGQFFFEDEAIDRELFRAQARRYGFDEQEYLAALDRVPRLSRETVDRGMAFLLQLADTLSQLGYSNLRLARLLAERDQLTASLQESQKGLSRAQAMAHLGSWQLDLETNHLSWSDEVYRIFGLQPQEFAATYEAFLEHVHSDDRSAVDAAYTRSLAEDRDTYEIEHRVVRKDSGEIHIVLERCEHIRDDAGRIVRSIGMVHDITARKQAEANQSLMTEVLQILNRRGTLESVICESLRAIQRATGFDAVGLRLRDGENYPYLEQSGFTDEFLRQESFLCALDAAGAVVRDAAGRALLECTCGLVVSGKTDQSMSCFTPGGSFWTNRSTALLALPPEDDPRANPRNHCIHSGYQSVGLFPVPSGQEIIGLLQLNDRREGRFTPELVEFYQSVAQNIGLALQRAASEEALRESETRYRSLFESSPDAVFLTIPDGSILAANPAACRMFGFSEEELCKKGRSDVLDEHDPRFADALAERRHSGQITGVELLAIGRDGERFPVEVDSVILAGEPERSFVILRDITERKQAEEAETAAQMKQAALEERSRLARDLHDSVTQALFAATLKAEALMLPDDSLPNGAARVAEEVRRLNRGALAQMRTLLLELRGDPLEDVPIAQLLRHLVQAAEGRASTDVRLSIRGEAQLPPAVQVATYRIAQEALNNVTRHAAASQAWVDLEREPHAVHLVVGDDGCGFEPSDFDPTHMGVRSMRERAEQTAAQFEIATELGRGTVVTVDWQLD